ncbi:winged helix-turn-helix domain-containing protein [Thermodesulfobium sp.]|jgi:predicted transcriptional regulator
MLKKSIRPPIQVIKSEMFFHEKIASLLKSGPKTIPEISKELNIPSYEVTMHLMAMRRYNLVEELPKKRRDDYYKYALKEK